MSFTVTPVSVTLNPLSIEVLLTHTSGATRTFVATRPEAVPYVHTGTRPITDEEMAAFQSAGTLAQKRAVIKAIVVDRLPGEKALAMAVVNANPNPPQVQPSDLPPSFTTTDNGT